ncbi:hypothetical protein ACIBKY_03720 [Nonomuraea sp. NPDC050394]
MDDHGLVEFPDWEVSVSGEVWRAQQGDRSVEATSLTELRERVRLEAAS